MANCLITGVVKWGGVPVKDVTIYQQRIIKAGEIQYDKPKPLAKSGEDGSVSFELPRACTAYLYAQAEGLNVPSKGVALSIPDAASAALESLISVASVPTQGLTVQSNGIALANRAGTFNFGPGITVVETSTGVVLITADVGSTEAVQDALALFFPDSAPFDWTYDDAGNRVSLDIATATTLLKGLMSAADKTALDAIPSTYATQAALAGEASARAAADTILQSNIDGKQPLDSDLTAIAALTPSNDDVLQRKSGAWTNRTPAQFKSDLALSKSDVGLSNVDNTSDATKNSAVATLTNKTLTAPNIEAIVPTGNALEQYNGTNAQALNVYRTRTDASNYERLKITGNSIGTERAGTGSNQNFSIGSSFGGSILIGGNIVLNAGTYLQAGAGLRWIVDNSQDIGQSASERPRTGYFGTSVVAPKFNLNTTVTPSGTADAQGSTGDIRYDADYIYVKTAAGWKRAALSTF